MSLNKEVKKTDEISQFQFGKFEKPRGGLNFSKMSEFQIGNKVNPAGEVWKFQKCLN